MDKRNKDNKGFTLVELLIVVVIVAVMSTVLTPVLISHIETSRNTVDRRNAKIIADVILYYFIDNPDGLEELTALCDNSGPHCVQVSVGSDAAIPLVLRPAMKEAGLIDSYGTSSAERFDIVCKSKTRWGGYRVAISNYSGVKGKPGELKIYYWGVPSGSSVHVSTSLGGYQNATDPTGFKEAMTGAQ